MAAWAEMQDFVQVPHLLILQQLNPHARALPKGTVVCGETEFVGAGRAVRYLR